MLALSSTGAGVAEGAQRVSDCASVMRFAIAVDGRAAIGGRLMSEFNTTQGASGGANAGPHGTDDDVRQSGSSPYATGGGGFLLEHGYGAIALSSLLLGEPMAGLGDEYQVTSVAMQQESRSPVDDLIVTGAAVDSRRTIRIACRRRPTIGSSSAETVSLFADYLDVLFSTPDDVERGDLRLGLGVSGRFGPATQLAELTEVARRQPTAADFEAAINAPGAHTRAVRKRLANTRDLVKAALEASSRNADAYTVAETTWSLLKALYVCIFH